ncbi:MAG: Cof-type HAD-IIB family hydrolase [Clostridiales Family XIII bacterium]|jgi:Cof subfamily protein (haloacid dehalogenase superfamily)|nr:Cof-type HAD-IIB family hydrolase [Clostridiales Family XIII bacterium]
MRTLSCVFTDLDGSLLNGAHRVSEADLSTIGMLKRRGIPVFLATGRHFLLAKDTAAAVGFDLPVCACNGGHIYDFGARKTLFSRAIARPVARETFAFLRDGGFDYVVYTPERVLFRAKEGRYLHWERLNASFAPENRFTPHFTADGFDPDAEDILKFLVRHDAPQTLARELNARLGADAGRLSVSRSGAALLDINAAGVNKGEAVRTLSARFGFRLEETMALGDSDNDAAMLRAVGIPVAPRNAEDAIRAMAVHITTDHADSPLTNAVARLFPALL